MLEGKGEGDELSVMRILWDIYDTDTENYFFDDEYSDKWKLGDKSVFDLMKGTYTLGDFWGKTVDKYAIAYEQRAHLGEVFEEYGVSSVLKNPMDDVTVSKGNIKFEFTEKNSAHSDSFEVIVFDSLLDKIVDQSGILNNVFEWVSNVSFLDGSYNWIVLNNPVTLTGIDLTKSYWSGAYQFSVVPEPGVLILFFTGMMILAMMGRGVEEGLRSGP